MSLRSPSFILIASIYLLLSLICTQIPLLNYLGYEFSSLIALVGSVASGLLTIRNVRRVYRSAEESSTTSKVVAEFKQVVLLNIILLVIPLVIMLTNALFVKNCSLVNGLAFFLLIPLVSIWFGSALGFCCAVHYRHPKIMFLAYCVLLLAYSAAIGYFTPAIFSYNFLYGYFPGLTYDEALGLSWSLVIFRVLTVLVGCVFVWLTILLLDNSSPIDSVWTKGVSLVRVWTGMKHRLAGALILLSLLIVWFFRGELGFESTSGFIQSKLGSQLKTEHFTIYYSTDSYDDEEIKWIAAEHEFRLKQVSDAFYIPARGMIESYVYPSSEVKQRLIGTGTTNIAKPWSGQIHITKQSLDATLKHELVHVVAAQFGLPVIKASLSTGLVEGVAMAVEWDWGNRTLHQYSAAMRKFGVMPDIEPLMLLTGFASQASSVSYVVCGSFCRFLIDRYGMRKMMQVYRTGDYNLTYGRLLQRLIGEWQGFLDRIQVADQDRDAIDVIFRRPPIFRKVCARVIAERNMTAQKKYNEKDYKAAEALYGESYAEGSGYEALSGYLASALRTGRATVLTSTLDSVIMKDPHPAQYLPLFITVGDAYWTLHNVRKAFELYTRVRQADLSDGLNESAALRVLAAKDTMANAGILSYFMMDANDTMRSSFLDVLARSYPQNRILPYLQGKVLMRQNGFQEALDVLSSAAFAGSDSFLEALRLRMMGYALFRLRRFQEAKVLFWTSLNHVSTEVAQNEVGEWVDRCEWMEQGMVKAVK
jgi:tetratricopeptide (TPR) repeat protein